MRNFPSEALVTVPTGSRRSPSCATIVTWMSGRGSPVAASTTVPASDDSGVSNRSIVDGALPSSRAAA